jgi:hypothetical protein
MFAKNSKQLGLEGSQKVPMANKSFKSTLLKMLGLSNTLSLWNLKQKAFQSRQL